MNDKKRLRKINQLAPSFEGMTDSELQRSVGRLRKQIARGKNKEQVLTFAFALIREADRRVLNLYPTDEQVLGGLALYDGKIAEMKTGEGKSLVATMPLFLKALTMSPVFLVTTNDYLARRDCERIGPVYRWLGLKLADGSHEPEEGGQVDFEKKQAIYSSDIIYISNSTLGFDYLIDGLMDRQEKQFMAPFNYALLDEVDEILLDRAQMPLLISGAPKVQSNYFLLANQFVQTLKEEVDFKLDEERQNVWLTEKGLEVAKQYLAQEALLEKDFFAIYQHFVLALKAHHLLKKARDYLIENGELKLLDSKDGRILEGNKLRSGLHQAIEAKEGIEVTAETQTVASVTYQNLFRQFRQLSGMSGTAKVAEDEFIKTYNLPVKVIRTHRKNIRQDHSPRQYVTFEAKVQAALATIKDLHKKGRPVLVITGSVAASEFFSLRLFELGIAHNVLNAKSSVKEAQIIQEAGGVGAVTVSTTMAGRGTDIQLEKESIKKGGLAVVVTERLLNKRTELQAKGRAGRQGEPGDTFAFESLEDEVIKGFVQTSAQRYYDKHRSSRKQIKSLVIRRLFNRAQQLSEDQAYDGRAKSLQFDEVIKLQKQAVLQSRKRIIDLTSISKAYELIDEQALLVIRRYFSAHDARDGKALQRFILENVDYNFKKSWINRPFREKEEGIQFVYEVLRKNLEEKRAQLNDEQGFLQYLKVGLLKAIDLSWSHQVNVMDQLETVVQIRSTAQKRPLREFEREAKQSYEAQRKHLARLVLRNVALSLFEIRKGELIVTFP